MKPAKGIDHIGITVPDLDEAQAYFEAVFGAEKLYDLLVDPVSGPELSVDLGVPEGTTLEAIRVVAIGNGPGLEMFRFSTDGNRDPSLASDFGVQHIALNVEDIFATIELIKENGGKIYGEVKELPFMDAGPDNHFVYTSPPWGGIIELVQIHSPQAYETTTDKRRWQPGRGTQR